MIDQDKMRALSTRLRVTAKDRHSHGLLVTAVEIDEAADAIDLLLAEVEAAAADKRENLTGDRLTDQKAAHIMQRDGYKLTGVVLCRDDGARCIVESSAVRWLTKDESWALMHPDDRRAPASEGEQK